jgi:hypothetical protein
MTEREKLWKAVVEYDKALQVLNITTVHPDQWLVEIGNGQAATPKFREWIANLAAYYQEKDRPFSEYLEGLLK